MEEKYITERNDFVEKAYTSARAGDLYQAYLDLDRAAKAHAAAAETNVCDCPLAYTLVVTPNWDKLCKIASEASEESEEKKARYERSMQQLAKEKERNREEWDGQPVIV